MLDEADERWIGEHGFLVDNPLLNEVEHAAALLRKPGARCCLSTRSVPARGSAPPASHRLASLLQL